MAIKAVLTGDLIHSQAADSTQAYIDGLKAVLDELRKHYDFQVEIFRGDGFQLVPVSPEQAFHCALALRAGLIAKSPPGERWDARIAVGVGSANSNPGYGEAYVLSGQGLDSMKRTTLMLFSHDRNLQERTELLTEFVGTTLDEWTIVEARTYFLHMTENLDQQGTARMLGKSRVTVNKALQRAHARLLDRYLDCTGEWIKGLNHA
ncbi:hypothetical protein HX881_10175 [Pseudomonas gingeri]|uniref:hypothetical protein n=1 Tax=Pseudomonas gingeri TaxID=117681 RepID=UPI0015A26A7D|nr:hypothetical protein [Pseudomonas gingeri]NVZ25909.1 hypothetical protein [Pseudomonas gingeri]